MIGSASDCARLIRRLASRVDTIAHLPLLAQTSRDIESDERGGQFRLVTGSMLSG
jgi:hypothetical protein